MSISRITKEELKERLEGVGSSTPIIVDVRLKYPYEHSTVTLPGALREPDPSTLPRDREIVTYDSDPEELVGAQYAATLIRKGFQARVLKGGIADWMAAKYPTDTKAAPVQAPPQAGSLKG
jgi:rhodanese-related sulfurtransferase